MPLLPATSFPLSYKKLRGIDQDDQLCGAVMVWALQTSTQNLINTLSLSLSVYNPLFCLSPVLIHCLHSSKFKFCPPFPNPVQNSCWGKLLKPYFEQEHSQLIHKELSPIFTWERTMENGLLKGNQQMVNFTVVVLCYLGISVLKLN